MSAPAPWRIWIDRQPPPEVAIPDDVRLTADLACADGAVVGADEKWDGSVCDRLPRLKVVARSGIGYDNVDPAGCAASGVAACNAPDAPTVSTAEHALALLLAVSKRLKPAERRLRGRVDRYASPDHTGEAVARAARERSEQERETPPVGANRSRLSAWPLRARAGDYRAAHQALELDGMALGLVGCGRIGRRVARYGTALGMRVLVHDPYLDPSGLRAAGEVEAVSLDELWHRSDAVSLHAPATAETRRLVDADSIAAMRPGVIIVNCARGSLIDHDALLAGLVSGRVGGAGLDVTEPEPLPAGHPLLGRDDVIVTPHVASSTTAGAVRLIGQALDQAVEWLRGGTPRHLLDPAAADPAVDRRRAS